MWFQRATFSTLRTQNVAVVRLIVWALHFRRRGGSNQWSGELIIIFHDVEVRFYKIGCKPLDDNYSHLTQTHQMGIIIIFAFLFYLLFSNADMNIYWSLSYQ